jgi:hypothetical protein
MCSGARIETDAKLSPLPSPYSSVTSKSIDINDAIGIVTARGVRKRGGEWVSATVVFRLVDCQENDEKRALMAPIWAG